MSPAPHRANIYNAAFVLLARDFDDNSVGAYAISEPDLVGALVRLHARLFRNGSRWNGKDTADSEASVDLVDVLGQRLVGSTDATVAQHLHISLRTYRRRVRQAAQHSHHSWEMVIDTPALVPEGLRTMLTPSVASYQFTLGP